MLGNIFSSTPSFLGVDFGTSSLKVVEVSVKGGQPSVINYADVPFSIDAAARGNAFSKKRSEERARLIALIKKMNPRSHDAFSALPGYNGLVAFLDLPKMKKGDISRAVEFEAHKYIPANREDVSLSWEVVGGGEKEKSSFFHGGLEFLHKDADKPNEIKGEERTKILLVAALKKDVLYLEDIFRGTNISLKAIELETFSLARSLVGAAPGVHLIADIGYRVCSFVLVDSGIVRISRSVDVGGNDITRTIADGLNISWDRAEKIKKEKNNLFRQKELSLIFPSVDLLIGEAQRVIRTYQGKNPKAKVEDIILSGGSSLLTGFSSYFSEKIGVPVVVGNPWKSVSYSPNERSHAYSLGAAYSVAIGLALRGVEGS